MSDAFVKMDLEQVIRDVSPRPDADNDDRGISECGDAVSNATVDGFSLVINTLEDAREALDDDEPDGKTVLAAMDKVIAAISQIEDFRGTLDEKLDALYQAERKLTDALDERDTVIDPDDLLAELEFHGYQLVKVPRRPAVAPVVKRRKRHLRAVG